jgi:hypothetical protein
VGWTIRPIDKRNFTMARVVDARGGAASSCQPVVPGIDKLLVSEAMPVAGAVKVTYSHDCCVALPKRMMDIPTDGREGGREGGKKRVC